MESAAQDSQAGPEDGFFSPGAVADLLRNLFDPQMPRITFWRGRRRKGER